MNLQVRNLNMIPVVILGCSITRILATATPSLAVPTMPSRISFRDEWILSIAAPNIKALNESEGCHLDEAICLMNYLNGQIEVEAAAISITAYVSNDFAPRNLAMCCLWNLFADVLVHFEEDRDKVIELLLSIQKLPPTDICWWKLPGFSRSWEVYRKMYQVPLNGVENSNEDPSQAQTRHANNVATMTAEAKMFVQGVYGITNLWAFRTINLVCEGDSLDVVMPSIHAWLQIAGPKLAETLLPEQVKSYERAIRGRPDKRYLMSATLYEHWYHWQKTLLQASYDDEHLSQETLWLAAECYGIMKAQKITMPEPK
ncbi:atg16-protein [Fusarium heterosporum]|uniref:Atg16-protein n=1 Tax=Fusarium heterosporum TaxID=42747 RepID=A0A8H5TPR9_FUSHE|nr:atg16-protein [Fusarium heterosporum]